MNKIVQGLGVVVGLVVVVAIALPTLLHKGGLHPTYEGDPVALPGKRAVIITTSHSTLAAPGETDGPETGVMASEFTHPYYVFTDGGMDVLVMLMLVVQSILAVHQHGLRPLVGSRDGIEYTGLADRAIRALNNTLISLVLIIPPVFTLALLSVSTNITTAVLQAFVVVRVGHFIVYLLGISWIRSCLWWTGLICTVYLYVICLGL